MSGEAAYPKYLAWLRANDLPHAVPLSAATIDVLTGGAKRAPRFLAEGEFASEPNFSQVPPEDDEAEE